MPTTEFIGPSGTESTSRPTMSGGVATGDGEFLNFDIDRQWQIATNSGFTTFPTVLGSTHVLWDKVKRPDRTFGSYNVMPAIPWSQLYKADITLVEDTAAALVNGRLPQGTYWVRFRWHDIGAWKAWSAGVSFTIAHVPSTSNRAPGSAINKLYATSQVVTWDFNDPDFDASNPLKDDFQLKYDAQLWKLSAPGSPLSSGLVTSGLKTHTFTGLDATWKDTELRWKVRVSDQDNVQGAYSAEQSFFIRDPPVANVTTPAPAAVITTAQPTFIWDALSGRTQASYRVVVATGGTTVADSGVILGTATSWALPTPSITVGPTYTIALTLVDQYGLTGADTNNTFTASYSAPATPVVTLSTTTFLTNGRVYIDWTTSTVTANNTGWTVYRRNVGATAWTKLATTTTDVKVFTDVTVPVGAQVEYSVSQTTFSVGVTLESAYSTPQQFTAGVHDTYMLVCPGNPSLDLTLWHVTSDSFSNEQEMSVQNLVGRGRRVEYGTRYGQTGSLSCDFKDVPTQTGRAQRLLLEALRDSGLKVYLRNPFGDVWAVAIQTAQITRVTGRGLIEDSTASLDYIEITA